MQSKSHTHQDYSLKTLKKSLAPHNDQGMEQAQGISSDKAQV